MGIDRPLGRPAVFLDRDGVLNLAVVRDGKPYPPASADELVVAPEAGEAVALLKRAGFELVVVTNQPDVARGTQTREAVEQINAVLGARLGLEHFRVCFHDNADNCNCRKPAPGLLVHAADELGIDLGRSYMVGDRWRDIEAGQRAGVKTVWLDAEYQERQAEGYDFKTDSLLAGAQWIAAQSH